MLKTKSIVVAGIFTIAAIFAVSALGFSTNITVRSPRNAGLILLKMQQTDNGTPDKMVAHWKVGATAGEYLGQEITVRRKFTPPKGTRITLWVTMARQGKRTCQIIQYNSDGSTLHAVIGQGNAAGSIAYCEYIVK